MGKGKWYVHRYKYKKQTRRLSVEELSKLMERIKKERKSKSYLGVNPLRDSSLLAIYYWAGLRLAEVVGDRKRNYKVSRFTKEEREEMKKKRINWKEQPDAYIIRTSPQRPGIRKEDIEFDEERNVLLIHALALKHGIRKDPLELSLHLPYVDLIQQQWERTKPNCKVWDLKREYAWQIIKELDPKLYPHFFRFNRVMEITELPKTGVADLLSWFGWRSVQSAYNYLELGARSIKKTSSAMVEQYTGKKTELPKEELIINDELKEEPSIPPKKVYGVKEEGSQNLGTLKKKLQTSKQWFFSEYPEEE